VGRSERPAGESSREFDLRRPERLSDGWRQVPRRTVEALRVAWRASPRQLLATLGLQAVAGIAMALQLLAAQRVLQELLTLDRPGASASGLLFPFAVLVGAMIAMGAVTALVDRSQRLLGELVAHHAMAEIIGVSTRVDLADFDDPGFHDQLERARSSAITRSLQMVSSVSGVTMNALTSAGIGLALLIMQPLLLPLVIVSAIPWLLATVHNSRHAYYFEWGLTPANRERAYLLDLLTRRETAAELRAFGSTDFLRGRYEALTEERVGRLREFLRRRLGVAMAGSVATALGMGLALGALVPLISSGRVEVSTALAAGAAMQQLSTRLFGLMTGVGQLVESGMFVDDYNSFLKLRPATAEPPAPASPPRPSPARGFGGVTVEGVSFRYPATEAPVLEDVEMHVDPGEIVALVGENGCGKTTLVKLICQLYEPQAGRIRWSGPDGGKLEPQAAREDTTVIFQDFLHFYLTAAENVALGRVEREPSPEAVRAAARQAGADRFLAQLPQGYETRLGRQFEDGHDLSIGQWQRLALARAFFRGGGFLVLDEPTASLDPKAEFELFREMRRLWHGRSVLLVSHRFSSVRFADRIYVLRDGRIVEQGSHEELLGDGGHYAELFALQAAAYLDDGPEVRLAQKKAASGSVARL
jgi:ATP-binding cassette, subfamily B, bacterial